MAEREFQHPPSSRDVAGEDFLFHLYRGSELLQDNRVHDAKAELEQALSLQPSDPKGQDLLGIVYFRLGMYPRAISIYERLIQAHPDAIEPRINLALSYLKTGQPAQARIELEKVLEHNPNHARAWGYLGLAFQRIGDYERASHAFAAGGHDAMAKRVLEMVTTGSLSLRPDPGPPVQADMRRAAGEAFHELDRTDIGFRPDLGEMPRIPSGVWSAIEPGREQIPPVGGLSASLGTRSPSGSFIAVAEAPSAAEAAGFRRPDAGAPARPPSIPASPGSARPALQQTWAPPRASELAREMLLVFPRDMTVALHASGLVLVQTSTGFATRLDAVRSMAYPAGWSTQVLQRRTRGKAIDEPLGGTASPLFEITGRGELVLGPTVGQRLQTLVLEEEPFYVREDAVRAFEISVTYENGRLPVGDGEAIGMLQLRGPGTVVLALPQSSTTVEVSDGRGASMRSLAVLGWLGRLVPRALLPSEAPAGVRGFVSFAGDGMVFVDAR